jgi:DNA-binding SARP family transcriptional activator
MTDLYDTLASQQFEQLKGDDSVKVIVIHPRYLSYHHLLNELADLDRTVYFRLDKCCQHNSGDVSAQFQAVLNEQVGASSLDGVNNLVLDEVDQVPEDALSEFLNEIYSVIAARGRVILIGRRVPQWITASDSIRSVARLVPVDNDLMLCDYLNTEESSNRLEVHAFGTGRVYLNGKAIDTWDGVLPRSLFFYLIDRGMTTRDDIFKVFWPNLTTKEATNVFHVTKRKISEVLGVDLTTYGSGFYHISPNIELSYDVSSFSGLVQNSEIADLDDARQMLERAVKLYRGEFLKTLELPWTQQRRRDLLQNYGEILATLAGIAKEQGDLERSLGYYERSALTSPQREDLVYNIMCIYEELGMIQAALNNYGRLKRDLEASLSVQPNTQLQEYAKTLQSRIA